MQPWQSIAANLLEHHNDALWYILRKVSWYDNDIILAQEKLLCLSPEEMR